MVNLKYFQLKNKSTKSKEKFLMIVEYMHGDADAYTKEEFMFDTEEELHDASKFYDFLARIQGDTGHRDLDNEIILKHIFENKDKKFYKDIIEDHGYEEEFSVPNFEEVDLEGMEEFTSYLDIVKIDSTCPDYYADFCGKELFYIDSSKAKHELI